MRTSELGECLACVQNGLGAPELEQRTNGAVRHQVRETREAQSTGLVGCSPFFPPTVLATQQQGEGFQNPNPVLSLRYLNFFRGFSRLVDQSPSSSPCAPPGPVYSLLTSSPHCSLCSFHTALILVQPTSLPPGLVFASVHLPL